MEETVRQGGPRVFLADWPLSRVGLKSLLKEVDPAIEICGEASALREAFDKISKLRNAPDLVIVDLKIEAAYGIHFIEDVARYYANTKIFAYCTSSEELYTLRCLKAGAVGYLQKDVALLVLKTGIKNVLAGEICMSKKIAKSAIYGLMNGQKSKVGIQTLSDRELQIFTLIGNGYTTRQISEQLHVSIKTVECHRAHMKEKLNLDSGTKLIQYAIEFAEK